MASIHVLAAAAFGACMAGSVLAHVPGEILVGRTAQNRLTALNGVSTPALVARSAFPGFTGYAIATIGFESLPADEPGDDAFTLSPLSHIRARVMAVDLGAQVSNGLLPVVAGGEIPFGQPDFDVHPIFSIPSPAAQNGQLYTIRFVLTDTNGVHADSDEITITLTPACPADADLDGAISVGDIFTHLNAFFAGSMSADFDQSGGLAIQDVFAFLNAWFGGACSP